MFVRRVEYICLSDKEERRLREIGVTRSMWIEEYDFSKCDSFELNSD